LVELLEEGAGFEQLRHHRLLRLGEVREVGREREGERLVEETLRIRVGPCGSLGAGGTEERQAGEDEEEGAQGEDERAHRRSWGRMGRPPKVSRPAGWGRASLRLPRATARGGGRRRACASAACGPAPAPA